MKKKLNQCVRQIFTSETYTKTIKTGGAHGANSAISCAFTQNSTHLFASVNIHVLVSGFDFDRPSP